MSENSLTLFPRSGGDPQTRTFKERVIFAIALIAGLWVLVNMFTMLRTILESFFWAMFLVIAFQPVADLLDGGLKRWKIRFLKKK